MGVYYRNISKRTMTVDGTEIAFTLFHGKAPPLFSDNTRRWNAFCTRAENNAAAMKGKVQYVTSAEPVGSLGKYDEFEVAAWNGQELLHDGFWDNNHVGKLVKRNGRWKLELRETEEAEEEWSPYTADYCDKGSIHHY